MLETGKPFSIAALQSQYELRWNGHLVSIIDNNILKQLIYRKIGDSLASALQTKDEIQQFLQSRLNNINTLGDNWNGKMERNVFEGNLKVKDWKDDFECILYY